MADPANPVRFDQNPDNNFYMCRSCRNHILSKVKNRYEGKLFKIVTTDCAVNIHLAKPKYRRMYKNIAVLEVFCNVCANKIGYKSLEASHKIVQEGDYMFIQNRLLYWDRNKVVYADTLQPV